MSLVLGGIANSRASRGVPVVEQSSSSGAGSSTHVARRACVIRMCARCGVPGQILGLLSPCLRARQSEASKKQSAAEVGSWAEDGLRPRITPSPAVALSEIRSDARIGRPGATVRPSHPLATQGEGRYGGSAPDDVQAQKRSGKSRCYMLHPVWEGANFIARMSMLGAPSPWVGASPRPHFTSQ